MTVKLTGPLKREVQVGAKAYTLTIGPEGMKEAGGRRRYGQEASESPPEVTAPAPPAGPAACSECFMTRSILTSAVAAALFGLAACDRNAPAQVERSADADRAARYSSAPQKPVDESAPAPTPGTGAGPAGAPTTTDRA